MVGMVKEGLFYEEIYPFLFLAVPLLIVGCSNRENIFDHSELKAELKEEGISPMLPTKFPVTIVEYEQNIPPHETNIYEVLFRGGKGEQFSLLVQPPIVTYNISEKEDITINGNQGFFLDGPGPSIHWAEGDYHYILTYYTEEKDTKELLIEIAESFQ